MLCDITHCVSVVYTIHLLSPFACAWLYRPGCTLRCVERDSYLWSSFNISYQVSFHTCMYYFLSTLYICLSFIKLHMKFILLSSKDCVLLLVWVALFLYTSDLSHNKYWHFYIATCIMLWGKVIGYPYSWILYIHNYPEYLASAWAWWFPSCNIVFP